MNYVVVMFMLVAMASAPAHADCASTVNSAVDRMMDLQMKELEADSKMTPEMHEMANDMVKEMKPKLKAAMTKACIDDAWSSEALTCMDDAATMALMERCEGTLMPRQRRNLDRAMNAAIGTGSDDATKAACGDTAHALADLVLGLRTIPAKAPKAQVQRRRRAAVSLLADLAALCVSDRWPQETSACMKSASSLTDLVTCRKKLADAADEHIRAAELGALGSAVDCVKTTRRALERTIDPALPQRAHMMWAVAETCSADWWSASSLACIGHAKTSRAMDACQAKLTAPQEADLSAVMTYAMGLEAMASEDPPSLPQQCKEYHAIIERLAACDKMPAQARAALLDAWKQAAAGWKDLTPDALANLATACKAGRDAVFESGKSVCGW